MRCISLLQPTFLTISTGGFSPLLLLTRVVVGKGSLQAESIPWERWVWDTIGLIHGQIPRAASPLGNLLSEGRSLNPSFY